MSAPAAHALDKRSVRRAFARAAAGYDTAAVLQREVGRRSLERLDLVRIAPRRVLDLGCGTGRAARMLRRRYPGAQVIAADLALAMVRRARRGLPWPRRPRPVCADAEALPFASGAFDLVYSNLMLQWCDTPERAFTQVAATLREGGLLAFTTFGPDTLKELRAAWAEVDDGVTHVNAFLDMHDVGDALLRCGYEQPVLDVERYVLTYDSVEALARDLKRIGARNATAGRRRPLTGKGRWRSLRAAYEAFRSEGVLPASYEVVYGHAWRGALRTHADSAPLVFHPPRRRHVRP